MVTFGHFAPDRDFGTYHNLFLGVKISLEQLSNPLLKLVHTNISQVLDYIDYEVASRGKEILTVCLHLLGINHKTFHGKPKKQEVILDFHFPERITSQSITENILQVLEMHKIDIKNCQGQVLVHEPDHQN